MIRNIKRKAHGFRNAVDKGSKIAKGASGKALDKVSDATSQLSRTMNNPRQFKPKQISKVQNAMSQLPSGRQAQTIGRSSSQEITARLRGKTTKSPSLPISNRSKIPENAKDFTASQKAKGLFPTQDGWVSGSRGPSTKRGEIKTRSNKERMSGFKGKQAEKAKIFQQEQVQRRYDENVSRSKTNLSNLFTTSAERLTADGAFKSIGASIGKSAVAGGLVGGTVNAVKGDDFWEGAGKGAIMGGAYGGISRGIKIAANAPKGSSVFQAMSDLNQEHNVSQSVKTLMRDQKLRRQSQNVAGNTM